MNTNYAPLRDKPSRYLSKTAAEETPVYEAACIHLGMLKDMKIKLTKAEIEHLFSLTSEVAIENWCHKIIMQRL
jgi:hypothetical protein